MSVEKMIAKTNVRMVISDLDGTLLDNNHKLSNKNIEIFKLLGDYGIKRVIATGRNFFSFNKVIPHDMPIDYLVFSSGAGIIDWKTKKILQSVKLGFNQVNHIANHFKNNKISFMVQEPIPNNHHFHYHIESDPLPDFSRRLKLYEGYAHLVNWNQDFGEASQFIVIMPNDVDIFNSIKVGLNGFKIIRATSPIDRKSIWMEIFPASVSKANAVKDLCKLNDIGNDFTCGFGNDYNDIDLLEYTKLSYVVSNAPEKLRNQFSVIGSNEENGVAIEIGKLIEKGIIQY